MDPDIPDLLFPEEIWNLKIENDYLSI